MPRDATCPACQGKVPVPKGTRYNTPVRCPMCDQSFVPPFLRVTVVDEEEEAEEPYDPETADAYKVKKPKGKKVRPKVSTSGTTEDNDRRWKPQRDGIGGKVLLGMGIGLGLVIPLAYLLGKWAMASNLGIVEMALAVIAVVIGILLVGAGLGLFANRFRGMMDRLFGPH
jgi:hypothetical protein